MSSAVFEHAAKSPPFRLAPPEAVLVDFLGPLSSSALFHQVIEDCALTWRSNAGLATIRVVLRLSSSVTAFPLAMLPSIISVLPNLFGCQWTFSEGKGLVDSGNVPLMTYPISSAMMPPRGSSLPFSRVRQKATPMIWYDFKPIRSPLISQLPVHSSQPTFF